ncbi:hypothetical protein ACIQV3_02305 [Streptomyces sp. NPDC099050]|uniref:hypothetical protein n=1 Tax=Streptomyces sp. NPDC099050 TaxID=3366100 RepID=UPI00381D031D
MVFREDYSYRFFVRTGAVFVEFAMGGTQDPAKVQKVVDMQLDRIDTVRGGKNPDA